jgi:mannose-6-phosphate isomerase-like protein (cupin superfamily)
MNPPIGQLLRNENTGCKTDRREKEFTMKSMLGIFALLFAVSAVSSGEVAAQGAKSAANSLPATYISSEDIQANINGAPNAATNPSPNVRVVDAGGYNVAVGVLHRPETPPGVAAMHHKVTEVYHVMDGTATLVTGGTIVDVKERPADTRSVRLEDGPSASGPSIQGGVSRQIKAGDVVVIPAGVPHWFSKIDGSITYVVVRFDPTRVLAPK